MRLNTRNTIQIKVLAIGISTLTQEEIEALQGLEPTFLDTGFDPQHCYSIEDLEGDEVLDDLYQEVKSFGDFNYVRIYVY